MTIRNEKQKIKKQVKKIGDFWIQRLFANLGDYNGVVNVANTENLVYFRIENGQVLKAINDVVPAVYNLPVFVGREKSQPAVWKIIEQRKVYAGTAEPSYVKFHHQQHEYPNGDTVFVRREQFMPLNVLPIGGMTVRLYGDVVYKRGMTAPIKIGTQDLDLSSHTPVSGAKYLLLELKLDGTLQFKEGAIVANREVLQTQSLPTPSLNAFPLFVFECFAGQTEHRRDDQQRTMIDLRNLATDTDNVAFQRNLISDLELLDGENLVISTYINLNGNSLTINGDATLAIV
jgi:hypothetical protein